MEPRTRGPKLRKRVSCKSGQLVNFARLLNISPMVSSAADTFFFIGDLGVVMLFTAMPTAVPNITPVTMPAVRPIVEDLEVTLSVLSAAFCRFEKRVLSF